MSDIDTGAQPGASSTPAAPLPASDPQNSAPASVDTTATTSEPQGNEPDRQARRESRAFAAQRRENRELNRELGRMQAELQAIRSTQQGAPTGDGQQPPRQEGSPAPSAADRDRADYARTVVERVEDAGEGIEGFDKVMETITAPSFPVNRVMMDFLGETEKPAEMAKWLADNPGEARRISRLSDVMAARALERQEAKLAKPAPKTTSAPPPVPTVNGRSTPSFDPEKASMDEYGANWKAKRGIK